MYMYMILLIIFTYHLNRINQHDYGFKYCLAPLSFSELMREILIEIYHDIYIEGQCY